jgi:hypothetical protein
VLAVKLASCQQAGRGPGAELGAFDPGADQKRQARQVRKWLEKLTEENTVEALEIVVKSPWSLPCGTLIFADPHGSSLSPDIQESPGLFVSSRDSQSTLPRICSADLRPEAMAP